jgi:tRNA nucleotidyltransferase/poly(A) polymerase
MLDHYNPILTAIRTIDPTAHIAGGAVRDTLLERPIKDIDLSEHATDKAARLLRSKFSYAPLIKDCPVARPGSP